jgi:hypothetical protein
MIIPESAPSAYASEDVQPADETIISSNNDANR